MSHESARRLRKGTGTQDNGVPWEDYSTWVTGNADIRHGDGVVICLRFFCLFVRQVEL
jgi:hypothetical protein